MLSMLGGAKLGDSVRKMLRVLGINNLWSGYSLKGKKTKKAFNSLPICGIIKSKFLHNECSIVIIAIIKELWKYDQQFLRREFFSRKIICDLFI